MKSIPKPFYILMVLAMLAGMLGMQPVKPVLAANSIRISQAYGGGGNSGATYKNDFIELFNSSNVDVSLTGWSVQYASSTGSSWQVTPLTGTIPANSYYLIQEAAGTGGTVDLPTPDATGSISMGGNSFKVALVDSTIALSGTCPTGVIDFVGAAAVANCFEGIGPAPAPSNTNAVIRKEGGCQDTDDNAADFESLTPTPRNTTSATHFCEPVGPIPPVINEFSASTAGTDVEFVEIFGSPNTDYSAYTLLGIEGDANASNSSEGFVDNMIPLGTTDANGFFLLSLAANALENGTLSFLLVKDNTATVGVDIDTDDDGVIDVTYWSEIRDGVAVNDGGAGDLTYVTPVLGVAYDGLSFAPGGASRIPDGTDTDTSADWVRNDFDLAGIPGNPGSIIAGEAYNTPGASNQVYVETAPSVVSTIPANGANHPMDENITITFSEPVTVTDPWYSIVCATSGTHTAVVTDADPVYTLNPDVNFTVGESCTVVITAANVVDDDTDDATFNAMLADYTFTFTAVTPPERCGDAFTPTYQIQGTGETSPLNGTVLATEGVVVGDFQVGGKNGYYIQDPTGDGDTATSDGIFVYNTTTAVNVGDHVRVRGTAVEYYGITEISPVTQVWICSTGNTVAATEITLPVTAVSDFEKYESMLVTFPQSLIISEYFNFDRYGEIVLTSTRHMTPTALVEPGAPAQAEAQAYLLDRITLDDGRTVQNPDPAIHPNGLTFNMSNLFRGGGTVTNATGILDFYQSLYRLQPTTGAVYADANPRTAAPEITEADVKVVSFNVLNYFVTLDDGVNDICGPDGIQECRGADDSIEFDRQKAKILAALDSIDADIFGLMEIENDSPISGNDAVADLVEGLNLINGDGTYAYIDTGAIGGDAIKQAILYKPAAVTPVGTFKLLTSTIDARFIDTANRPALAHVFMDNESGVEFVVAVNHLKSKGSDCNDLGDPDLGDGAGNCNLTRKAAAEALVDWLASPTYFPDVEKALIIGDLNSYDKEDPIDMIKLGADDTADTADDFKDMIFEKQGENAYGYVFDGQTGYLDHALASLSLAENIADVNFWHNNADEPDLIDYDTSFKLPAQDLLYAPDAYRSSDHDPVIVTLSLLGVINVDLLQSTDPLTLETSATPVYGNLADGFTMVLDPAVEWYYFDTDTITSNRPLADGSYPFYLEGTAQEIFTLEVNGTDYFLRDTFANDGTPLRVQGNFPLGEYTYVGIVEDETGVSADVSLTITFVAPLVVTDVDLEASTIIAGPYEPLPGSLEGGFAMALDPTVEWYYFDTDTIASNRPLADGSYPFYLQGTTTEIFTLVVNGTDYFLHDTYANDGTPLRVQGNFPLDSYTYVGEVADSLGSIDEVSLTITFVAPLAVTEVELEASTIIAGPYESLPGNLAGGFTMVLDPAVEWYYFDTDAITSNRPLADGSYPFYLEGTTTEVFTLVVNGTDYFLRDTYANDGTPLRVQGYFQLGAYTYVGDVEDTFGFTDEVSLTITFVAPLSVTEVALVQSTDLSTWTPVDGNLAEGFDMNLDTTIEYYYLDAESVTSNRPLGDGSYPFFMTANPGAEFFAYWAERGVVDGATSWQGEMWDIINGDAPMFYLKVEGGNYSLIDGLQGEPNPLRVNGSYYPGLYGFTGAVEDTFGFEDELIVSMLFNDIPLAEDQAVTVVEDTPTPITLTAVDIYTETLTFTVVTPPAHGTLSGTAPALTYTPALNYVGPDSFIFTVNDGMAESAVGTISITVTPVNDNPIAVDDEYDVDEDDVLTVAAPGVMANDIEVDTDSMTVVLLTNVSNGSLVLLGDGSFTYTPDPDFNGEDSFTYRLVTYPGIQDAWTDDALVTITVNPVNDAPVAEDQDVTTAEDAAKDITLTGSDIDGDTLTYALVDEPAHGDVVLAGSVATYTPDPDFNGEDSFTFTATDGTLISDMAVVTITVTPVNDAPVAVEDDYTTDEDTVLTVLVADGVLDNDSDLDGDVLTAVLVSDVSNGTLALAGDGSFVYTPNENYFGTDSFTYKASDGILESSIVTVTITITPVNDWVVANDDEYETMAGITLDVAAPGVLTNDELLDPNETVNLSIVSHPSGGTLTLNTDGSFTYVPNAGFFGMDTFVYQLNATLLQGEFSDMATVTITVTAMHIFLPLILR